MLRISLIQSEIFWNDVEVNLLHFSEILCPLKGNSDLIILPEMFTSGFMMDRKDEIAPYADKTLKWMTNQSLELGTVLVGSIIVCEDTQYYNRLYAIGNGKIICSYDKRHLFRMGEENHHFQSGSKREIFTIGKWRICPLICYDLRFPVWSRGVNEYDLLIYVANWPEARTEVWNTLLKARAIENQAFVAGVNRVGLDGMKLKYSGSSSIFDAKGKLLGKCNDFKNEILNLELSLSDLKSFRQKFPVHLDADSFQIDS
ncbi:amidohydrolase [Ancylomarina longa]|uniref:Omega-amidase YafV n=1 Tax=Ancylomarina longa TaxID=2487017 RepID=A0A434AX10_9BACT|nr:amidohydrolase [Ancylomarina longa]RUT79050.1 amidohydrolase [Ancylomarina longa]